MKKTQQLFLCIAFMLAGLQLSAQSDTSKIITKHKGVFEAGTNLYSLTFRPGNFYTHYKVVTDNQVFSGLYLKYYKGKNALRWELNYSQRNLRYNSRNYGVLTKSHEVTKSFEIKMGYQRSFGTKKLSLYAFTDLEYNRFWTPNYNYFTYYDRLIAPGNGGSFTLSGSMFCVTPGLGVKWRMGKHLVLNVESAAQFFFLRERPDYFSSQKPVRSIGINARPLKFTLGFVF